MAESLVLGIYQGGVLSADGDANMALMERVLLTHRECDVVVFPELFLGGYNAVEQKFGLSKGDQTSRLVALVRQCGVGVCTGWAERDEDGMYWNVSLIVDAAGTVLLRHRKTHLWGSLERSHFHAGDFLPPVITYKGVRISTVICYEVEFPLIVREMARRGCQVLLVPTAVAACTEELSLLVNCLIPTRAMENNMFIAYVNRSGSEGEMTFRGMSTVANPYGKIIGQLHEDCGSLVVSLRVHDEIEGSKERNTFARDWRKEVLSNSPHT
jgi:predicted amidohydrolase